MHLEVILTGWSAHLEADYGEAQRIIGRQLRAEMGGGCQVYLISDAMEAAQAEGQRLYRLKQEEEQTRQGASEL